MTEHAGGAAASPDGAPGASGPAAIELRGIVKRFPGVVANDGIDLAVQAGLDPRDRRARTAPASRR